MVGLLEHEADGPADDETARVSLDIGSVQI
jgi:hypothetical protein